MKVLKFEAQNVLGMRQFEMDLGQITEISGKNAQGKTSVLAALQNAIGGGSIAELKNINADDDENARLVLLLQNEDGTNFVLDKSEKSLKLKKQVGDSAAFETVGKPQQFLNNLRDCKLSNPMDFLNAKNDKERVELILQAVDLSFSRDDLWREIDLLRNDFPAIPDGMNPLNEIAMTRDLVFDKRTGVNTSRRDKRAACEEARRTIPAEIPTVKNIAEKVDELANMREQRQKITDVADEKKRTAVADAEREFELTTNSADDSLTVFIDTEKKALDEQVQRLEREMNARVDAENIRLSKLKLDASEKKNKTIANAVNAHRDDMEEIEKINPEIDTLNAEIAELREREKNIVRIITIKEQADKFEKQADSLDALSEKLMQALKNIDNYKASLSKNLPVPGLDISDNKISIDGVPWSQLNHAQRIIAAVQIIAARAKKLPLKFCLIDGAESLDSESQKVLEQTLLSNDIQAVICRVENHELQVKK